MALSSILLEFLKKQPGFSDAQVFEKAAWGSQNPSHRTLMREELSALFSDSTLHTSVSHCEGSGIVVASRFPIGVDVEVSARVEDKVVARISSLEELKAAPNAAALWSAKEACFKALRSYEQPSVISKISVGAWQNIDSQTETYRLLNAEEFYSPSENHGIVLFSEPFVYSFFVFHS